MMKRLEAGFNVTVTPKNNSVTKKKAAKSTKHESFKSYLKLLQGKLMSLSGT